MKAVELVGERTDEKVAFRRALVDALGDHGRVGRAVYHADTSERQWAGSARADSATETYEVGSAGWTGAGEDGSIDHVLDRLATRCDYAIVDGYGDTTLPQVHVGDDTPSENAVAALQPTEEGAVAEAVDAVESVDHYETLESLVASVKRSADADLAGAIATFTGRVREKEGPDDEPTEYLEFERYDEVAARQMDEIRKDLEAREGVHAVRLHHKVGVVEAGEDIVFVVVLAGHRDEAFRAVADGIDRLKAEVPLFKKEVTVSDEFWAHES